MHLAKKIFGTLLLLWAAVGFSCKTRETAAVIPPAEAPVAAIVPEEPEFPVIPEELPATERPYTFVVTGGFPSVPGQETFSAAIKAQAISLFQDFEAEVQENDRAAQAAGDLTFKDQEFTFDISWKAGRNDRRMSSILLDAQWYTGEAHGAEVIQSFTWDADTDLPVTLRDILPLIGFDTIESLAVHVQEELEKKFNPKGDDRNLSEMIRDGTSARAENFSVFLVERESVIFYFQRYQVAPGSYGVQSVTIRTKNSI
jgi:hypothetical protein